MTPEAALALGALIGLCFGYYACWLVWANKARDLELDLDQAERHIRRLEDVNEGLAYKTFWQSEATRLRNQHKGTPYAGPGVRGDEYSAAWIDEDVA